MIQCKQCGADLSGNEVKSGISKKNGKPYRMVKCDCGGAEFLPALNQSKPMPSEGLKFGQQLLELNVKLGSIEKKIDLILNQKSVAKPTAKPSSPEDIAWDE